MENYFFENVINKTLLNMILPPKIRLQKYFDFSIDNMTCTCCKRGCPFINLGNETSDFYPAFREKISRVNNRHLQAIETCIQDGIHAGEFLSHLNPSAMAKFILAEVNGSIILSKVFKSTDILKENIDSLMNVVST